MRLQFSNLTIEAPPILADPRRDRLFIKHKHRMQRLFTDEIYRVEANRAYCRLITAHGEFTISVSLAALERQLPPCNLLRVHRSHMVNLLFVDSIGKDSLTVRGTELPLSQGGRRELQRHIREIR